MIRFFSTYFPKRTVLLGFSELCLVCFALVAATITRLGPSDASSMLGDGHGSLKISVVSATFMTCMYYFDLYDSSILSNSREVFTRLIQVLGTVCILLALVYYLYPPLELGRGISLIGLVFVATLLSLWRKLFSLWNSEAKFSERTLMLGNGPLAEALFREFESRPELGLRIVGRVSDIADNNGDHHCADKQSSSVAEFLETVTALRADRVVIAMAERRGKLPIAHLLSLKCHGVRIEDGSEMYEAVTGKVPIESICLSWLLFSPGFRPSRALLFYKRVASILVSAIGLILSLPLLPFIILAIKLTSPGALLYRQKRVGRDGAVFYCNKFRTMRADAEASTGPAWATDDDPRITTVGRIMRKTRMDEIPQLWNVLVGDMSLVGPRPERP